MEIGSIDLNNTSQVKDRLFYRNIKVYGNLGTAIEKANGKWVFGEDTQNGKKKYIVGNIRDIYHYCGHLIHRGVIFDSHETSLLYFVFELSR
jgi:hypothetical protein